MSNVSFEILMKNEHNIERKTHWGSSFDGSVFIRPGSEEELDIGTAEVAEFYTFLSELPIFKELEQSDDKDHIGTLRQFPQMSENFKDRNYDEIAKLPEKGHLLLRPIGATILASAVSELIGKHGANMGELFQLISKMDIDEVFNAHLPKSIFYALTYNPKTQEMDTKQQDLAKEALIYLIKGGSNNQELMDKIVQARTLDVMENVWIDFSGNVREGSNGDFTDKRHLPSVYGN